MLTGSALAGSALTGSGLAGSGLAGQAQDGLASAAVSAAAGLPAAVPVPAATLDAVLPTAVVRPPAAPPQAFASQLSRPVATLAQAGPGEHIMTVKVTPENLGPVTVQARIGADGVRIELFAPTDAGRAAVQAVLPDLRRDLAGTGLGASLDLSQRSTPQQPGGQGDRGHPGSQPGSQAGGTAGGAAGGSSQGQPGATPGGYASGRGSGGTLRDGLLGASPAGLGPSPTTAPTATGLDILV